MTITSLANERVKRAVRLRRRKYRDRLGLTIIDGVREIELAAGSRARLREVFFCPRGRGAKDHDSLVAKIQEAGAELIEVTPQVFARLAFGDRDENFVAVAEKPSVKLADLSLPEGAPPLVTVLEGVEKPGNLGAIVRTADAAGVDAVIVAEPNTDPFNPNAIRASLGSIFQMPVAVAAAEEVLVWLRAARLSIFAARVDAAVDYTKADLAGPAALVLGAEATGLSSAFLGDDVTGVRLPMAGVVDSLNVSAAAAALFYEARRQRSVG